MLKLAFDTELDAQRAARLMGYEKSIIEHHDPWWTLPLADYGGDDKPARNVMRCLESRNIRSRLVVDTALEKKPLE